MNGMGLGLGYLLRILRQYNINSIRTENFDTTYRVVGISDPYQDRYDLIHDCTFICKSYRSTLHRNMGRKKQPQLTLFLKFTIASHQILVVNPQLFTSVVGVFKNKSFKPIKKQNGV